MRVVIVEQETATVHSLQRIIMEGQPNTTCIQSSAAALVISASNKAGMDGIDRERIDSIILRESENTLYMQQQKRRDEKVNQRIAQMKERLEEKNSNSNNTGTINWKLQIEHDIQVEIEEILQGRRNRSTACVLDMDMFFMACELLSKPHLKDFPCCVGGGMISTSNYKARQFGVRSGMAGWIGDKLVEELSGGKQKLVHVKSNYELYQHKSQLAKTVIRQFDPRCRCPSLDEAFIDLAPYLAFKLSKNWSHEQITSHLQSLEDSENNKPTSCSEDFDATLQRFSSGECLRVASDTVELLRRKVCEATGGLTCSAGLAPSFTIAKIASDVNKPNGQKIVGERLEEDVWPFLRPLPTRKIPFIGRVTQKMLQTFGIATVQQLYDERALVRFLFKSATAKFLLRASLGGFGGSFDEENPEENDAKKSVTNNLNRKGISRERTFRPGDTWSEINNRLEDIARMLAKDMEKENVFARTVSLKVKLSTFDVFQRSRTVDAGTALQKGDDLMLHATEMLHELRKEQKGNKFALRLLGVRCSNLMDSAEVSSHAANQRCMAKFLAGFTTTPSKSQTSTSGNDMVSPRKRVLSPKPVQCNASSSKSPGPFLKTNTLKGVPPKGLSLSIQPSQAKPKEEAQNKPRPAGQSAHCPICNKQILADSSNALNHTLNEHIDSCLNAPAIRQAVQEETKRSDHQEPTKKRRLTDFFSAS